MSDQAYTPDEMMVVEAARHLSSDDVCFVGIGLPSTAANLARLLHAPGIKLIYESGTIETRPSVLPLSIGDGELAETARAVVSVPEIFGYWLQGGRVTVGFLGAAQVDRFGNLNTTVIGAYDSPKVRLPGAGGAPEIAACAGETFIMIRQSMRALVNKLDFISSPGHLDGGNARARLGLKGKGPTRLITDLGVMEPHPETRAFELTALYPGVTVDQVRAATGWPLQVRAELSTRNAPSAEELSALRDLKARTDAAHQGAA
ncbi:CoA-transferase subunit beta [Sphingopyxis sp. MC1]|uniref:CoA-transferase subunit beta n=1 Tax=Sphingopyxis sp. MC1 TaxID=1174684 RepID=UPI0002D14D0F|nr:CoA-transferase [Sphingopyxis sp. MC1]ENY82841.1 glutaconate CoA transferase subunit B [Sphingopyxis sp. MC1]MBN2973578.1 CoA-transferase subunit beta [Roseomonas aeriglobus]